jgi:hypothetical protein
MTRVTTIAAALLLLGAFGCKSTQDPVGGEPNDEQSETAEAARKGAPTTAGAPSGTPPEAQLTPADLPLPADFDPEAEREITDENVAEQLAAAEREVAADEQAPLPALKP